MSSKPEDDLNEALKRCKYVPVVVDGQVVAGEVVYDEQPTPPSAPLPPAPYLN